MLMRSKISIYTACFQDPEVKVPEGGRTGGDEISARQSLAVECQSLILHCPVCEENMHCRECFVL